MYIYTPGEPAAVPVQPGPDTRQPYLFAQVDLFSRGLCGNCTACPKVWRLEVPVVDGLTLWSGTYYLKRNPYSYRGSFSEIEYQNCTWESGLVWGVNGCPISDARGTQGDDQHGWVLIFGIDLQWRLITPLEEIEHQLCRSIYRFPLGNLGWRCLAENTFHYDQNIEEFPYPITPEKLTLTPYYG